MADKTATKTDRFVAFLSLWIARIVLATLAFAGCMSLLGSGVDDIIRYPLSVILVGLLVKETL